MRERLSKRFGAPPDNINFRLKNNELEFLRITGVDNLNLFTGIFDNLSSLKRLELGYNCLTELPLGIFDNLSSLESLWLEKNSLIELPLGIFDNLSSLESLWLGGNGLIELPPGIFEQLIKLKELSLHSNYLVSLPIINKDLTYINLTNNPLLYNLANSYGFDKNPPISEFYNQLGSRSEFPFAPATKDKRRDNYGVARRNLREIAGNICSFPLCMDPDDLEAAHIGGRNIGSRNYDPKQRLVDNKNVNNLTLLCKFHHQHFDHSNALLVDFADRATLMTLIKYSHENMIRLCLGNTALSIATKIPELDRKALIRMKDRATSYIYIDYPYRGELQRKKQFSNSADFVALSKYALGIILNHTLSKRGIIAMRNLPRHKNQDKFRDNLDDDQFDSIRDNITSDMKGLEEDKYKLARFNRERRRFMEFIDEQSQTRGDFNRIFDKIQSECERYCTSSDIVLLLLYHERNEEIGKIENLLTELKIPYNTRLQNIPVPVIVIPQDLFKLVKCKCGSYHTLSEIHPKR